jgi:hypothetical protein
MVPDEVNKELDAAAFAGKNFCERFVARLA